MIRAAAVVLLALSAALVGYCYFFADNVPSSGSLEARIEKEIQRGATVEEIIAWGETDGAGTGISILDEVDRASNNSPLLDEGVPGDTPILHAIIRSNSGRFSPFGGGVRVYFILDQNERFVRVIAKDVYNGP